MGKKRKGVGPEGFKKKHKKRKRKHCTIENLDVGSPGIDSREEIVPRPIKLKIKLGDQLISSSETTISDPFDDVNSLAESEPHSSVGVASGSSAGDGGGCLDVVGEEDIPEEDLMGSDISVGRDDFAGSEVDAEEEVEEEEEEEEEVQEEEAWLVALETGQVNERGYLPQKKDFNSMTARQRAMLGGDEDVLMELPVGRSSEELTEEMLLKKTEKNRKRRLAAQKRKEKRKSETVRKLLEKQSTKKKDEEKRQSSRQSKIPLITYISSLDHRGHAGSTLSLPHGMEFPMMSTKSTTPPIPTLCAVDGCHNPKKYSDSLTQQPVCSLQCYRILHNSVTKGTKVM